LLFLHVFLLLILLQPLLLRSVLRLWFGLGLLFRLRLFRVRLPCCALARTLPARTNDRMAKKNTLIRFMHASIPHDSLDAKLQCGCICGASRAGQKITESAALRARETFRAYRIYFRSRRMLALDETMFYSCRSLNGRGFPER
jgi:hypothetical protein